MNQQQQPHRTNKHPNTIRRNVALHAQIYGLIAEQREQAGLARYLRLRAMRQFFSERITT